MDDCQGDQSFNIGHAWCRISFFLGLRLGLEARKRVADDFDKRFTILVT